MTRSFNTIFQGSKYNIRSFQKFYLVTFKSGKRVMINKSDFTPNIEMDEKTLIDILENIQRVNQKKRFRR